MPAQPFMIIIHSSSSFFHHHHYLKDHSKLFWSSLLNPPFFVQGEGDASYLLSGTQNDADHKIRRGGNKLKFSSVHSREIPRSVLMERGGKRRRGRRKFPCNAGIRRRTRDAAGM